MLRISSVILLAVAAALPTSAHAVTPAGTAAVLDAKLDRIAAAPQGPPGVSVIVQRGGKIEYRRRGVSDVRSATRPTPRQHVRIASMAKAFSGAVALALVAQGKLSLDDTIGERLPGLLPRANDVTLRQALHHTGGLPDYIRDAKFVERLQADPAAYMTPRQLLAFVRDTPPYFTSGMVYGVVRDPETDVERVVALRHSAVDPVARETAPDAGT